MGASSPTLKNDGGLVLWFSGLPGSGKSTIARLVLQKLRLNRIYFEYVSMDQIRRKIFPNPGYTDQERDAAYRAFVLLAGFLSRNGVNVILDGTGHRRVWRDLARAEIPTFIEVYVKCPIEVCMEREARRRGQPTTRANLYRDALKRLRTGEKLSGLGSVPGVDEPFEESEHPDIVVDSSKPTAEDCANLVAKSVLTRIYAV